MSARVAVGVDAGGSKTVAVASLDGVLAGEAAGAPASATLQGVDVAAQRIAATVRAASPVDAPAALFVGAAGAGSPHVASELARLLHVAFPGTQVHVEDDARCALRAAIASGPGIVLIAGTGSVAYAENGAQNVRVGGAGYLLGDEGSAFAIGMGAVRLLARALDGRAKADETTNLVARALAAPDRESLLAAVYGSPLDIPKIAGLAPSIIAFAGKGNRASTKLVQRAAEDLCELIVSVATQANLRDASPQVALAGGLFRENSLLSFLLEGRVAAELPGAALVRSREQPAHGALRLAEALLA